jgi:hypothetical protein
MRLSRIILNIYLKEINPIIMALVRKDTFIHLHELVVIERLRHNVYIIISHQQRSIIWSQDIYMEEIDENRNTY